MRPNIIEEFLMYTRLVHLSPQKARVCTLISYAS